MIEIAEKLLKLRPTERACPSDIEEEVRNTYPAGSVAIQIDGANWAVINDAGKSGYYSVNVQQYRDKKYNPNLYLGTTGKNVIEPIDSEQNKEILIDEAYKDIFFIQKNIEAANAIETTDGVVKISSAEYPKIKKAVCENLFDKSDYHYADCEIDYVEEEGEGSYDEIYRIRCLLYDTAGNQQNKTFVIKAVKVLSEGSAEDAYSYTVLNENATQWIDELDKKINTDTQNFKVEIHTSDFDEDLLKKKLKAAINGEIEKHKSEYSYATKLVVTAIYYLRFKKIPILVNISNGERTIAKTKAYYSPISSEYNEFLCPTCGSVYGGRIRMHIGFDFYTGNKGFDDTYAMGCNRCMTKCGHCGKWHFKQTAFSALEKYTNENNLRYTLERPFIVEDSRKINYTENPDWTEKEKANAQKEYKAQLDREANDRCECREDLLWVKDEMSGTEGKTKKVHNRRRERRIGITGGCTRIVDYFLTPECKMVFLKKDTGEKIADYNDLCKYLALKWCARNRDKKRDQEDKKEFFDNFEQAEGSGDYRFIGAYILQQEKKKVFDGDMVRNDLDEFKAKLGAAFSGDVVISSERDFASCLTCGYAYYVGPKSDMADEYTCVSCEENPKNKYWIAKDGTAFFRNGKEIVRTHQKKFDEILYEKWREEEMRKVFNSAGDNIRNERKASRKSRKGKKGGEQ